MSATPSVADIIGTGRMRRRRSLGATRVMSYGFTAFALFVLGAMLVLFVLQSLPVWRHAGISYLTGRGWYFRREQFGALPMLYGSAAVAAMALLLAAPGGVGGAGFTAGYLPRGGRGGGGRCCWDWGARWGRRSRCFSWWGGRTISGRRTCFRSNR